MPAIPHLGNASPRPPGAGDGGDDGMTAPAIRVRMQKSHGEFYLPGRHGVTCVIMGLRSLKAILRLAGHNR